MKKLCKPAEKPFLRQKNNLKMKLTIFLLIVSLCQIQANPTYGQNAKITLNLQGEKLEKVLDIIETQTDFKFMYNDKDINYLKAVSLQVKKEPLSEVLKTLFKDSDITYIVLDKQIILKKNVTTNSSVALTSVVQHIISGTVFDEDGVPMSGASIVEKGTTNGIMTDFDGKFELTVQNENAILEISYLGYQPEEVSLDGKTNIQVIMKVDAAGLEEVVVVGFGTQKKESLVSAVSTIKVDDLKIPSSNLTTALAGRASGVISYQRSGEPGADNAEFFIRGVTTFGYKVDPLILIDNVEVTTDDLARLVPDDIDSFSILKDATATAIYGARGANGVILIKTKMGVEGAPKINLRIENSYSASTRNIEFVDPVTYMNLHNEATLTRNPAGIIQYPLSQIDQTVPGADPYLFPQVDWRKSLIQDFTANQRVNLSVAGGGEVARYSVSTSLRNDNGLLKVPQESNFNNNINLKSYTIRSNVDVTLGDKTTLIVRLNGIFDEYNGPIGGGQSIYNSVVSTPPTAFAPFYPKTSNEQYIQHILFGLSTEKNYVNPYAELVKGYKEYSNSKMEAQLELKQDLDFITDGLRFRGLFNTSRYSYYEVQRQYRPFYYDLVGLSPFTGEYIYDPLNEESGSEYLDFNEIRPRTSTVAYTEAAFDYSKKINENHNITAMTVFTMRHMLKGNSGSLQESLPFRNLGVSSRLTYGYKNRYFTEFNFGYNGSERFHKKNRFGFFPSLGAGWVVSNEEFWKPLEDVVSNFKIRGSYGVVGNDAISSDQNRFQYLSEVNMNNGTRGFTFGDNYGNYKAGISLDRYANDDITWERGYKSNIGIELGLFNKAELLVDIFKENRKNIFMQRADVPTTMGLTSPIYANIGEATSSGVDLQFKFNHAFNNGSWLQMMGNFTYATSEYNKIEEPAYDEPYLSRVGYSLRQQWGYIAERLFIDDEEVANSPEQIFGNQPVMGGDIKYKDVNGDGKISALDKVPIGLPTTPEIIYGAGFSAGHKSFDFSAFFQGSARSSFWINPALTAPFISTASGSENQVLKVIGDDYWSESDRDLYSLWPRLSTSRVENNEQTSTWFMRNGDFLRLKQLEIGFTFPSNVSNQIKATKIRIYANGTNLLTFSKFKLWDIEMAGNGLGYPIQRVINIGLNANF